MAKRKAVKSSTFSEEEFRDYVHAHDETPLEQLDRWREKLAELVRPYLSGPIDEPEPNTKYVNLDLGDGLKWYVVDPDLTEQPKDPRRANEPRIKVARYAIDALIQIFLITGTSHEPTVFRATVLLGTFFERIQFAPFQDLVIEGARIRRGRKDGLAKAIEARRKGTIGPVIRAHAWMTEYLKQGLSQRDAAEQTRDRFLREQNVVHGASTIIGWWKKREAECAAT